MRAIWQKSIVKAEMQKASQHYTDFIFIHQTPSNIPLNHYVCVRRNKKCDFDRCCIKAKVLELRSPIRTKFGSILLFCCAIKNVKNMFYLKLYGEKSNIGKTTDLFSLMEEKKKKNKSYSVITGSEVMLCHRQ